MTQILEPLRQQIASHEAALQDLRQQLAEAERNQQRHGESLRQRPEIHSDPFDHDMNFGVPDDFRSEVLAVLDQEYPSTESDTLEERKWPLEQNEYKRYGRQLIMPEIGLQGELACSRYLTKCLEADVLGCRTAQTETI